MDKRKRQLFLEILLIIMISFTMFAFIGLIEKEHNEMQLLTVFSMVLALTSVFITYYQFKFRKQSNSEIEQLNELMQYNQRRKEIEQKIEILTRQLMQSEVADYLDINRLVFSGQSNYVYNGAFNYNSFFEQFGINTAEIKLKENTALFLTPFTREGERLYQKCQNILADLGIVLRKTDNLVEKDDILMNIVYSIVQSELILVNIDGRNPNVYYELGIAHAIGKPTILLAQGSFSVEEIGFDIRQKRVILYNDMEELEKQLLYQISIMKKM